MAKEQITLRPIMAKHQKRILLALGWHDYRLHRGMTGK